MTTDSLQPALNTTPKYLNDEAQSILTDSSCILEMLNLYAGPTTEQVDFKQLNLSIKVILT